jgi:hypothetical protein
MTITNISDEIISALSTLAPSVDPTKATLEIDPLSIEFSNFLAEPSGLELIEFIQEKTNDGKPSILIPNKCPDRKEIERMIYSMYTQKNKEKLFFLLDIYHFFWIKHEDIETSILFGSLKKIEQSKAIISKRSVLKICSECTSNTNANSCCKSTDQNILEITDCSLHENVGAIIRFNQHMEIYVKSQLNKIGIKTIGWDKKRYGKDICTSVTYQIDGEPIEVDTIGISTPLAVLLIEVKTSKNTSMNEIRKTENKFEAIIKKINNISNRTIPFLKIFITSGEFDSNLSIDAYRRKNWDFIDRSKIMKISDDFERLKKSV